MVIDHEGPPVAEFAFPGPLRAELADPGFTVDDTTPVVLERFRTVPR